MQGYEEKNIILFALTTISLTYNVNNFITLFNVQQALYSESIQGRDLFFEDEKVPGNISNCSNADQT